MKLYYSKGACSLAIRIIIHEIGVTSEFEAVNLKNKTTEAGENYLLINPKGAVPALMTADNELLTENLVIQLYLAEKYKATNLLPTADNFKRYRVLEWLNYISTDVHKSFGPLFNPNVSEEMKETVFIPLLRNKLVFINDHLINKNYLLNDQFTLPDAYLFVVLRWVATFKIDLAKFENLSRYVTVLANRESIVLSLQEEGLKK
ncbi:MAG: glutathione transferase GstA [Gammaproteobacteria bacterium RIFCSPHIGHO2_12_FULL_35_23]|nr:MAG: glutathione transferase GstA [Gammaproteobacteria bacterium RIFCSPHIGHO2_12_FULL_35_23]